MDPFVWLFNNIPSMQLWGNRFNIFDVSWIIAIFLYTFYRFKLSKTLPDKRFVFLFLMAFSTAVLVQFLFDEPYTIEQWFVGMAGVSSLSAFVVMQLGWIIMLPVLLLLFFNYVSQEFQFTKWVLLFVILTEVMQFILSWRHFGDYTNYVGQARIVNFWLYYIWQRVTFGAAYVCFLKRGQKLKVISTDNGSVGG
jgi:membrane-associated HD superfamily phosphohydrolase